MKQRHGKGRTLLPNSDYFEGFYKEGLRHGEGHYIFKGGAQYKGGYKEGMKHGIGTFFYPDGSKYKGKKIKLLKFLQHFCFNFTFI